MAKELYQYRTSGIRDGITTLTQGWSVPGRTVDNYYIDPDVPRYGDEHPDNPNMLAREINATPRGSGVLVTVSFTPRPYFGGSVTPVNQFADNFIGNDVSFETDDVEIPLFQKTGLSTTDGNGLPVSLIVYDRLSDILPFRKRVPYYRIPIAIDLVGSTLDQVMNVSQSILEQTDKIHTIFGRDLVFACEGMRQQTETRYSAVYRFYQDPGIPNTLTDEFNEVIGPNLGRIGNVIYPFADSDFIVEPFKGLRISGATDPTQPPSVNFFDIYKRSEPNGEGWLTLPGLEP